MIKKSPMLAPLLTLLAWMLLLSNWTQAWAQSASCTGVAAWNPATIYSAGQRLTYKERLFEAAVQIWNTPPDHCSSCNWYRDLGSCGTTGGGGGGTNNPPNVQITAPVSGASFTAPASITLTAAAADTDGTISKVDFFRGSTLLGTDTSAPYSFS